MSGTPPDEVQRIARRITEFLRRANRPLTEDTLRFLVLQADERDIAAAVEEMLLTGPIEAVVKPNLDGSRRVSTDDFLLRLREESGE